MFGTMGRRAVEAVVGVFAILGFCFVPLGSKTGFQHSLALLGSAPVREAGAGLVSALARARVVLVSALLPEPPRATPLPLPTQSAAPVIPTPPELPSK